MTAPAFDLAAHRAEIAALHANIQELEGSTFQREEARQQLADEVQRAATEGAARVGWRIAHGRAAELMKAPTWAPMGHLDLLPLFALVLGPAALMKALKPCIDALPPSIPAEQRTARLADLRARLLELEEAEETHILALEALGQSPGRRGDADPAVVLRLREV